MTVEEWSLSDEQRADTVERIRANVSSMSFFRGTPLAPEAVAAAATAVEKKAYTVARVEARTTTGVRPHHESLKAYARKLSALVLEVVSSGGQLEAMGIAFPAIANGADITSLDLTGSREFLTRETAEELLAPMLVPDSKITRIKLSTKSFGIDAAEVAATAIRNVAGSLTDADLSDVIAGRPEDEALAALRIMSEALGSCNLRHLNLSDNALGEKGIRACAAAFAQQPALESIAFQNVGCSVHGCAAVEELLQRTESLSRLHLLNNMSGDEGAASIARLLARCPAMQDFKMASSRVGAAGGIALAHALASGGTALRSLDVHDNPLTAEVAPAFAAAIAKHPGLRRINLNDTCLEGEGVTDIASAIGSGVSRLEELQLELNEITPEIAPAVAAAVRGKTALRVLNLRENELEDEGAVAIARVLATLTSLQQLDLCTNQIKRGGACAIAKAVASLPSLEILELNDNEISEAGIEALHDILRSGGKLEALGSLADNCPDEDDDDEEEEEGNEKEANADVDVLARELQREHL